jgi:hypothetical protein
VTRVARIALKAASGLLLGLAVVWAFGEYAGASGQYADSEARPSRPVAPLPCPFHSWR